MNLLHDPEAISFDGSKNIDDPRRLSGAIPGNIGDAAGLQVLDMYVMILCHHYFYSCLRSISY